VKTISPAVNNRKRVWTWSSRATFFAAAIFTAAIGSASPAHSDPPCYKAASGDCVPDPEQTPGGHHRQAGTPNAGMAATRSASTARVPVPAMVALNSGTHNGTRKDMKHFRELSPAHAVG
jgi:hypothetical protein